MDYLLYNIALFICSLYSYYVSFIIDRQCGDSTLLKTVVNLLITVSTISILITLKSSLVSYQFDNYHYNLIMAGVATSIFILVSILLFSNISKVEKVSNETSQATNKIVKCSESVFARLIILFIISIIAMGISGFLIYKDLTKKNLSTEPEKKKESLLLTSGEENVSNVEDNRPNSVTSGLSRSARKRQRLRNQGVD